MMKTVKRTLAVVLTLLMLMSVVPLVFATSKTADEAIAWVKTQEGKALDYDGAYGAQCVDLIMYYYKFLGVSPSSGNGKDYATNTLPAGWTRTKGGTPQKGDILVYSGSSGNTYGHVAIFESTKVLWHGRWSGTGKVQKTTNYSYNYSGFTNPYWGCIHPNFASNVKVTFNGNGGTPSKTSESFAAGETYGNAMPSALRNGYSFDGWYTSASGGTWCGKNTVAQASVTTLYAHWSKNNTGVLQVGHIYKIYNKKSGLPLQTNGSGAGAYVCQRAESTASAQLWRVTCADENGYYSFESLNGGNALDMDGTPRYDYLQHLQLWTPSDSDAQKFSLVKRETDEAGTNYYSIHVKYSGRALDIYDSSTEPGAAVIQWDSHRGANQLFYFTEFEDRLIKLYQNNNGNYLPSPKEVYEEEGLRTPQNCYSSRNPEGVVVTINPSSDSLTIKQITPDKSADMKWVAAMGDSNVYSEYEFDDTTMELRFTAKASVSGAKIWFRWGFDSIETGYYPVALTTGWADYTLTLPRTRKSGNNLHPYIDKACTVEMKNIAMYAEGTEGYIGDTDAFSYQTIQTNIHDTVYLPSFAEETREDGYYQFDGWYTKRIGGIKVSDGDEYYDFNSALGSQCLYAHWMLNTVHMHTYTSSVVAPSCEASGYTINVCETCGNSYMTDVIPPIGHDYKARVKEATCTQGGYSTYTCTSCGDTYIGNEVKPLDHNYIETYVPESCTKDGYTEYKCSRCSDSYKEIISAIGHLDENNDGYCDYCNKELRPHDNPTNTTNPTEPTSPSQTQANLCKWCGKTHDNGFIQKLIGFFHNIFAAIFGAKF